MANPYTQVSTPSSYSNSPPSDDAAETEANRGKYATIKTKLGDPLEAKTVSMDTNINTAFGTVDTQLTDRTATTTGTTDGQVLRSAGDGLGVAFEWHGIVQVANTETGAVATGTTTMPADDTIPQNTEGTEFMTLAITPKDAGHSLYIEVTVHFASTAGTSAVTTALFKDSTASAIAAMTVNPGGSDFHTTVSFKHKISAGSTSAQTFKVRIGGTSAGTVTFNGVSGGRIMGGVMSSSITITEVAP